MLRYILYITFCFELQLRYFNNTVSGWNNGATYTPLHTYSVMVDGVERINGTEAVIVCTMVELFVITTISLYCQRKRKPIVL